MPLKSVGGCLVNRVLVLCGALAAATASSPASASELFGGLYAHAVDTPITSGSPEGGLDVQLGWRGGRIGRSPLQPYVFAALNTSGDTSYAAAGVSAQFGRRLSF